MRIVNKSYHVSLRSFSDGIYDVCPTRFPYAQPELKVLHLTSPIIPLHSYSEIRAVAARTVTSHGHFFWKLPYFSFDWCL